MMRMASVLPISKQSGGERVPPHNLEAERGVLGSILLMNDALDEVAEVLIASHFYHHAHELMYAAILDLHERGVRGIDAVTLAEELQSREQLEEIGGPLFLHEILEAVPHAAHARYYADIVRDKWMQRSLIVACTEVLRDTYDPTAETEQILETAERKIFSILEQQEGLDKIAIRDILLDAWDNINERLQSDSAFSGLPTGFSDLDTMTNGFQNSELLILAARPSMGKTALICNWSIAVTMQAKRGVLLFSLEQSKTELAERFMCIQARVNGHRLRSGELDDAERDALMRASQELGEAPLFIDDKPGRTMSQIGAITRRMKRQNDIGLVMIDYLQLIEAEDRRAPREQQVAQITRRLKFLAKEMNIPVIALAQLNRGVESRTGPDKKPRLSDLRESGSIEQDADVVIMLHRPEVYEPDNPELKGLAEVIIAKNRSGPVGTVRLTWRNEFLRFENWSGFNEPDGGYFNGPASGSDSF
jgi:replicative DNA helicase